MNMKTIGIGNILAWNTGEHYFVDTHKTKRFHREGKRFQRQIGMWRKKKLYVTSKNIIIYAVLIGI